MSGWGPPDLDLQLIGWFGHQAIKQWAQSDRPWEAVLFSHPPS